MTDEYDEEDLGWAFRVLQLHGSVIRRPADVPAWRTAIRKMARERGIRVRTGLGLEDASTVWAHAPTIIDTRRRELRTGPHRLRDALTEEGQRRRLEEQGPGGWNWDKRARYPDLKAAPDPPAGAGAENGSENVR